MNSFLIIVTEDGFEPQNTNNVFKGDAVSFAGLATNVTVSSDALFGTATIQTPVANLIVIGSGAHFGIATQIDRGGSTATIHGTINVWRE